MTNQVTKKTALVIAALMSFLGPFLISAVNIALPAIQKEFSINTVLLSWITTSYILAAAAALLPAGRIADIYGRKIIYVWGVILFSISTFMCVFVQSAQTLIFMRIIQGVGSAMVSTTGMAILTSVFPFKERGRAIGINVAAVYLGLSSGPFIGGFLTQHLGWRSIFIVSTPLGLVAILLVVFFLKGEWADAKGEKFDYLGSIIYCFSLVSLMYGISNLSDTISVLFVLLGLSGFIVFVRHETRIESPVFDIQLFRNNRAFTFSCLAALINYAATFAVTFLLSLYLQYITGLNPQTAGLVLMAQPIMQALFSPSAGRLSDKIEPRIIASFGMGLTVVGLFLLFFLSLNTPPLFITGVLVLLGVGFALFSSPNMNAIMSSIEKQYYGIASGSVATMRTVGMTISMAIATLIFSGFLGKAEITPEIHAEFIKSIRVSFIVFTLLCLAGIYFSLARGKIRKVIGK
ncbi:MAG: MFS transporter [Desulfobacterales bacterium]|nr:MFS transporter [Desulfobacterales bacterium]